jgi:D-alanyl-lipoteichoic acid acyltransferase DltB (MBOAT superfamily)
MLFNTARFFVFLGVVLALFYTLPRRFRKYLLLTASYFFYASWNPKFIGLLLSLTAVDFTAGIWLERTEPPRRRRAILIGSLAANLGFLGFFKYYNFLAVDLATALGKAPHSFWLDIVLPLGISFHTFQSISYVVDVFRRRQKAIRSPIDYALFISFFPQLVAGPIVRARDFFADLYHWRAPSGDEVSQGIFLLTLGLTKKMAFADQFAAVANAYFGDIAAHSGRLTAWSGACAFAMQIYFDFSGYTDMAIGMAKLFGFHFPINFRRPYLARGTADFWRRWHISLSTWLRDYLYIPLGGNRRGRWLTYRNLMITMLLGGLWHGANWNFLIWGGYHGALLSVERAAGGSEPKPRWSTLDPLRALLTFTLATIGWVFFRASDLHQSVAVIGQMFAGPHGKSLLLPWHIGLAAVALAIALAEERWEAVERLMTAPAWAYAAALAVMLFCLEIFGVIDASVPFIYFQF